MRLLLAVAASVGLVGCSTPTGFVPIGDGIYMASNMDGMSWSGGSVKADLYKQANDFCSKQGKQLSPVSDNANDASALTYASAEIKFRCR